MQVRIDNVIVNVVAEGAHYYELNTAGQKVREHRFPDGTCLENTHSVWCNGHHYKSGARVNEECTNPDCECCHPEPEPSESC